MNYQNTYPSSHDYVIEADYTEILQESLGTKLKNWLNSPCGGPSPERAIQQMEIDRSHAFLAASALRHTVAFSAVEPESH